MSITQAQADAVLAAAQAAATRIGVPMNVAVLDDGANLKAFLRMDDALLGSVDIAMGKAKTSALFGMSTEDVGAFAKPGGTSPASSSPTGASSSSPADCRSATRRGA
jgi:uncharacterized protein GlcG (DUF336 family)